MGLTTSGPVQQCAEVDQDATDGAGGARARKERLCELGVVRGYLEDYLALREEVVVLRARARRQDIAEGRAAAKKTASAREKDAARKQAEKDRSKTRRRQKQGRLGSCKKTPSMRIKDHLQIRW